jgi:hypothetical protein
MALPAMNTHSKAALTGMMAKYGVGVTSGGCEPMTLTNRSTWPGCCLVADRLWNFYWQKEVEFDDQ